MSVGVAPNAADDSNPRVGEASFVRVRLRPNWGFPLGLTLQRHPQNLARINSHATLPIELYSRVAVAHFLPNKVKGTHVMIDLND